MLKLNTDKTQWIVSLFVSRIQLSKVNCNSIHLGHVDILFLPNVTCLSVILDVELTVIQHVCGLIGHFFLYQLRQMQSLLLMCL